MDNQNILNLNNICPIMKSCKIGTKLNDLNKALNSSPIGKYEGALLTDDEKSLLDNKMCLAAKNTSLGTEINNLLSASKNTTEVESIGNNEVEILNNKMCPGCGNSIKLGTLMQQWAIIINDGSTPNTNILTFSIENQEGDTTIDNEADPATVELTMPNGSDITKLSPIFTLEDGSVMLYEDVEIESGVTEIDFTDSVDLVVEDKFGNTKDVTVTVNVATE